MEYRAPIFQPERFIYELPPVSQFFEGRMLSGHSERMFRAE
jgi:hypothetical protein